MVCLAVAVLATAIEGRNVVLDELTWPGDSMTLLAFIVLHAAYFQHQTVVNFMDVLFNTLIYWGMFLAARTVYRWIIEHHAQQPPP